MTSVHLSEAPGRTSLLGRWAAIVVTAALFVALYESIHLAPSMQENKHKGGVLALYALLLGNWLPYTALGASLLVAIEVSARWLVARNRSLLWLALSAAVLVLPYAGWLAHYTMSGPNVGSHPLRRVGILALGALIAVGFSATTTLVGHRQRGARFSLAVGVLAFAVSGGAVWLSGAYLPNEYEPLHAALGYTAILAAVIGAGELSRKPGFLHDTKVAIALCVVLTDGSLASGWILAESNRWAWLVWGETGWLNGRGSVCKNSRLVPTHACGRNAFGQYHLDAAGKYTPWALILLEISQGRITEMTFFLDTDTLFPRFGFPPELSG